MRKEIERRINEIKKSTVCALIVYAALCFCACGKSAAETPNADTSESSAMNKGQEIEASETDNEASDKGENQGNESGTDENGKIESDTDVSSAKSSVSIVMKKDDTVELTTDDGTVYYTVTCGYPIVSIEGNDAAAEKINADIGSRVESFYAAVNSEAEWAKEDFEYLLNDDDNDYTPYPYSSDLSFTVTRADDRVISFTANYYEYMGGAHGLPATVGINYDTNTGELIAFTDLGDNPDTFHADTLAYNQELARTEDYSEQLFSQDDITNGTPEDVLYADGSWYLSTSGLVFMSPPYALAPYAAGTLEFIIPYSELSDMGFKEIYAYTGRQITKLWEDNHYSADLNGDGSEESITCYDEWVSHEDGSYEIWSHLVINEYDFAQDGTDDVREQLTSGNLRFSLYDLDVEDNYVELAAVYTEYTQNEGDPNPVATHYSKIFRYAEDGSLIYLGQADGDVTDPSVIVSELKQDME